jgi:hypothetical protein
MNNNASPKKWAGPLFTIDRAIRDPRLLGAAMGDAQSWATWLIVLRAAFGLPLDEQQLQTFHSVAGDRAPPNKRVRELWCIVGRRGGKSRIAAALAVWLALFTKHNLASGERGMVLVLAASVEQAKVVFSYARAFITSSPVLRKELVDKTQSKIRLKNGVIIGIHAASYRTVRGRTLCGVVLDELAYFRTEDSATPDTEIYSAILPALATTGGLMVAISTPYRKIGLLHQKHKDHFGIDSDDTLIVQGASKIFNATLDDAIIAAQRQADPTAAGAEWLAEFRADIAAFLDDATIEAAIDHGRPLELPPQAGISYCAFVDASGGRSDAYTCSIGHKDTTHGRFVIDVVRGVPPPFDPGSVTKELADLVKEYHCHEVTGDSYAAEWVAAAWEANGVRYVRSDLNKSEIYLEALPLFTRGLVSLPDHARLLRELRMLERRSHRSGKDSVDHGRSGHDDFANSVAGVLRSLSNYLGYDLELISRAYATDDDAITPRVSQWQHPPPPQGICWEYREAARREQDAS